MDKPIEYRVLLLEKDLELIKVQQGELKGLKDQFTSALYKMQTSEQTLIDMKEKLDDYKADMKTNRDDMKTERQNIAVQYREMQSDFIQQFRETKEDNNRQMKEVRDEFRIQIDKVTAALAIKTASKDGFKMSDDVVSLLVKIIGGLLVTIAATYGIKLL